MAKFSYKVVPFIGSIKSGDSPENVSRQLQSVIDSHAAQGWEFWTFNDVNIAVQPGCLAGLMGQKSTYMAYDQLVFRREE